MENVMLDTAGLSTYAHQAYQRLMLSQMGITPWVSPATPVQSFDIEAIFFNRDCDNVENFSQNILNYQNDTEQVLENINIAPSQQPAIETLATQTQQDSHISQNSPAILAENIVENLNQTTCRYHIQAMALPNWIFIADSYILQQDTRQLELWQKIGQSMQATFYELQFPLINQPQNRQLLSGNKNDPNTLTHLFASETLGMATFQGFVHSLMEGGRQVGYLTPLPEILLKYPMQALPMLSAMLDDLQQKKTLWQLMQPAKV